MIKKARIIHGGDRIAMFAAVSSSDFWHKLRCREREMFFSPNYPLRVLFATWFIWPPGKAVTHKEQCLPQLSVNVCARVYVWCCPPICNSTFTTVSVGTLSQKDFFFVFFFLHQSCNAFMYFFCSHFHPIRGTFLEQHTIAWSFGAWPDILTAIYPPMMLVSVSVVWILANHES